VAKPGVVDTRDRQARDSADSLLSCSQLPITDEVVVYKSTRRMQLRAARMLRTYRVSLGCSLQVPRNAPAIFAPPKAVTG
jgi:hypothetical protein